MLIFFIIRSTSALVSAMPSVMACCTGGGKLDRLKLLPEPRLSWAKRAMRPVSEGFVGQNWSRKLRYGKMAGVVSISAVSLGQLTVGAAGGADWRRKALRGSAR